MQGVKPLASPGLNPGGTGAGWCNPAPGGVACLLCRLLPLPLAYLVAPIPPTPFPAGRGRPRLFHARGFAPCIPGIKPPAALTVPVVLVPGGIPGREPLPVGFAANYGFSSGDARGEAPCIRKLKVSPFPPGRGLGGWGRQRQLTAGAAGDQKGKPPLQIPEWHGQPATSRASSRIGYSNGRSSRQRKNTPSPQKKPVSLLTGFPPSCIIIMRKAGVWLGSRHLTQDLNNL